MGGFFLKSFPDLFVHNFSPSIHHEGCSVIRTSHLIGAAHKEGPMIQTWYRLCRLFLLYPVRSYRRATMVIVIVSCGLFPGCYRDSTPPQPTPQQYAPIQARVFRVHQHISALSSRVRAVLEGLPVRHQGVRVGESFHGFIHKERLLRRAFERGCPGISIDPLLTPAFLERFSRLIRFPPQSEELDCEKHGGPSRQKSLTRAHSLVTSVRSLFAGHCGLYEEFTQFRVSLAKSLSCIRTVRAPTATYRHLERQRWSCFLAHSELRLVQHYAIRILSIHFMRQEIVRLRAILRQLHTLQGEIAFIAQRLTANGVPLNFTAIERRMASIDRILCSLRSSFNVAAERSSERLGPLFRFIADRYEFRENGWYRANISRVHYGGSWKLRALPRRFCRVISANPHQLRSKRYAHSRSPSIPPGDRAPQKPNQERSRVSETPKEKAAQTTSSPPTQARRQAPVSGQHRPPPAQPQSPHRSVRLPEARPFLYCRLRGIADHARMLHTADHLRFHGCIIVRSQFLRIAKVAWEQTYVRAWFIRKRSLLLSQWYADQSRSIPSLVDAFSLLRREIVASRARHGDRAKTAAQHSTRKGSYVPPRASSDAKHDSVLHSIEPDDRPNPPPPRRVPFPPPGDDTSPF